MLTIQAAQTALLATPEWSWRYESYSPPTPKHAKAAKTLREKAEKARTWLASTSLAVGLALPLGNGTNGPWHLIAVVSDEGTFAIMDIARGVLNITDTTVPDYVRLFAVKAKTAQSHNDAGGSGSIPPGWSQIGLVLSHSSTTPPTVATIVQRVSGFRTCYGTCPAPETSEIPTTLPQWEDLGVEIDPTAWNSLMGTAPDVRLSPGHMSYGNLKLHRVSVFGSVEYRRERIQELRTRWDIVASEHANVPLLTATPTSDFKTLLPQITIRRRHLGLPCIPNLPSGRCGWEPHFFNNVYAIRNALQFLGFADIMPPDPATPEHKAEIARIAQLVLAVPPAEMARRLRDPWGMPGYIHGTNRPSYLIEHALGTKQRNYAYDPDVEDFPGVSAYCREVRTEVMALSQALYGTTAGPNHRDEDQVQAIINAGWTVTRGPYGSINASIG